MITAEDEKGPHSRVELNSTRKYLGKRIRSIFDITSELFRQKKEAPL
jgi:hypothetical protein